MGIDSNRLLLDIEHLAYCGIVLSVEQKASLQTSLAIARDQYKFARILFWGKILGTKDDYFIAVGVGKNEMRQRTFLYRYGQILKLSVWFLFVLIIDCFKVMTVYDGSF